MRVLDRPALSLARNVGRRFWHTHTWIRFTRWQDAVKEKKTFAAYEEAAKVHTDPVTGLYLQIDDPSEAIRKPYEDRTREEVGGYAFDNHARRIEWQYMDLTAATQNRYQRYQDFLVAQYDQRSVPRSVYHIIED